MPVSKYETLKPLSTLLTTYKFCFLCRMEKGPSQDEGKALIRHLIRLGYMPSRGELSTMSQSDQDYEDLYSYIKNGPNPLKDLCVRKIRQSIPINVTRGMERGGDLSDKARTQVCIVCFGVRTLRNVRFKKRVFSSGVGVFGFGVRGFWVGGLSFGKIHF